MAQLSQIMAWLEQHAPLPLAAPWDNVGLLAGDPRWDVERVMTCLTITPNSAAEAVAQRADLVVTHHPLPFRPLSRLTADGAAGGLLLELLSHRIAVYSAHTAYDSAPAGINQQLAEILGLTQVRWLCEPATEPGSGRLGELPAPQTPGKLAQRLMAALDLPGVHLVGNAQQAVRRVALACGSAGELLPAVLAVDCQCLVTGELRFHDQLALEARGCAGVLLGHFASERFAQETLASRLAAAFDRLVVWPSRHERDPWRWQPRTEN